MRRAVTALVGVLVAAGIVAVTWAIVTRGEEQPSGVAVSPGGRSPFDETGALPAGTSRARFSPSGANVAVLVDGAVDLAVEGELRSVTPRGGNVVDAAWFPNDETLLVAEGPSSTGALAVVDIDGRVRGSIPLSEPVPFGTGYGMDVDADGRRAALTAVRRETLGPERRYVVEVDLETGAVRPVTEPGGPDEFGPRYVDGGLAYSVDDDVVLGVVRGVDVARQTGDRIIAGDVDLGRVPAGTTVVDVSATGNEALVVSRNAEGQPRLRMVRL